MRFCSKCRSIYTAHVEFCGIDGARLIESADDPLVGYSVDRYLVHERLGLGATGCVYRVSHSVLEQEHAMKILFGDLGQDLRLVERFKREAKAIGKIRHPNVVTVSDFGCSENGLVFLVMELVRGPTLHDHIACSSPLSPAHAARIMEQIAAGLGEAHRLGYVHRDIKPTNIVLVDQNGEASPKILDFGIVGLRTEPLGPRLTSLGFLVGTPAYMAPEQASDPSHVTPSADFYSLGVIGFQMLTGRLPFEAEEPLDLIIEHSTSPVPALGDHGGLEDVVVWMLQKRPADRPQSAEQVLEALARLSLDFDEAETVLTPVSSDFDLPLLEPVTYVGTNELLSCEALTGRLHRLQEILLRAPHGSELPRSFEAKLRALSAAVQEGLRTARRQEVAAEIGDLEKELLERMRFWPA